MNILCGPPEVAQLTTGYHTGVPPALKWTRTYVARSWFQPYSSPDEVSGFL